MNSIIKIKKSLENSSLLIDGANAVKHETKNQESGSCAAMIAPIAASLMAPIASSLVQPVAYPLINGISWKESWEQEKDKKVDFFQE